MNLKVNHYAQPPLVEFASLSVNMVGADDLVPGTKALTTIMMISFWGCFDWDLIKNKKLADILWTVMPKAFYWKKIFWIFKNISLKFVCDRLIDVKSAFVWVVIWCQAGDELLLVVI